MRLQKSVTSRDALIVYYDVECLENVFTLCAYSPRTGVVEVFYLVEEDPEDVLWQHLSALEPGPLGGRIDEAAATRAIVEENPAWHGLTERADELLLRVQGGVGAKAPIFHDLRTWPANLRLIRMLGPSEAHFVNHDRSTGPTASILNQLGLRPVCDTDDGFDPFEKHPYLAGYNSDNYDTTIMALYFMEALGPEFLDRDAPRSMEAPRPFDLSDPGKALSIVSPRRMRAHNDQLFSQEDSYMPRYLERGSVAQRIHRNFMTSGRHLDISRLNETQKKVALKRLLGGIGEQILESESLGTHNARVKSVEDFHALLAYNVSDVIGLEPLFAEPVYSSAFDLKAGLLQEYPELIYAEGTKGSYEVRASSRNVRRDRLRITSTSAQFVGKILSPYGHLKDFPEVSFMYPSEEVAAERGIPRMDVLEAAKEFFFERVQDESARERFMEVYGYYASIRGQNFNDSEEYAGFYGHREALELKHVRKARLNLPYFRADGSESSCFASFSYGGIHGAEANVALHGAESADHLRQADLIRLAQEHWPDPCDLVVEAKRLERTLVLPDGSEILKRHVVIAAKPEDAKWRSPAKDDPEQNDALARTTAQLDGPADVFSLPSLGDGKGALLPDGTLVPLIEVLSKQAVKSAEYREEPRGSMPQLFEDSKHADGGVSNKLKARYAFTSCDEVIHEDFTSYYPNMLRNLSAFYNERLGEDRYAKILADKDRYGSMLKAPGLTEEEKQRLGVLRNGTKLILNSASGAGDTNFTGQPIRVNNAIISMRLIGQVFTWWIGQAQTLAGARIVSTNTDGLYSVLDEETNNRVLAEESARINVEIEPEPMIIVSKDSNNRLELVRRPDGTLKRTTAGGGSLACMGGPRPDKSLAHPALLDWALARYLTAVAQSATSEDPVPLPWRPESPLALDQPMDRRLAEMIVESATRLEDRVMVLRLFQNILAASSGRITFPFASEFDDPLRPDGDATHSPRPLQHYNRMFVVKAGTPGAVSLKAAGAWKVTAATEEARAARNESSPFRSDRVALEILQHEGWAPNAASARKGMRMIPVDQDVAVRRITGVDPSWPVLIRNDHLKEMPHEEREALIASLDLPVYVEMLIDTYESNWKNEVPEPVPTREEAEEAHGAMPFQDWLDDAIDIDPAERPRIMEWYRWRLVEDMAPDSPMALESFQAIIGSYDAQQDPSVRLPVHQH